MKLNYAIKPTPELALRSNQALPPARLFAALGVMNMLLGALFGIFVLAGCVSLDAYQLAGREILKTTPEDPMGGNVYYCWQPEGETGEPECRPGVADAALEECLIELLSAATVPSGKGEARNQIISCMNAKHWDHVRVEVMY